MLPLVTLMGGGLHYRAVGYFWPRRKPLKKLPMWRPIWPAMGGGVSGWQSRNVSSSGTGHFSWKWTMVPGAWACSSTSKAWRMTRICCARLLGWPRMWPKGNSTASARGTPILSAQKGIFVTTTVETPAASKIRASTGTLAAHSGQAAVSSAQSTSSASSLSATWGP
jgi:hypothetical protein